MRLRPEVGLLPEDASTCGFSVLRSCRRHYLSDVLAGLLLGVATVALVTRVRVAAHSRVWKMREVEVLASK